MERAEHFRKAAEEYFSIRFKESAEKINSDYATHKMEVRQNFTNVMHEGIIRCKQMGKKVKYVVISILESSSLTKSYELQVAFYDEKIYADDKPVYVYWKPLFVFSGVEEDMAFIKKKISEKIVRIKDYEMDNIKEKYILNHYLCILLFLQQIIPDLFLNDDQYSSLNNDVQVMFGRYMERPMLIYRSGEVS